MRARLVAVLIIPLIALLVVLGAAYCRSLAHAAQQRVFVDRLGDVGYFVTSARQALRADDASVLAGELARYRDVYGIEAAVVDRAGTAWVTSGLDVAGLDEAATQSIQTAMSGRASEPSFATLPWEFGDLVVAEPIFEAGDMIGVVVTSSSTDRTAREVLQQWGWVVIGGVLAIGIALLLVVRLASWVLRPVRRVDDAMTEMWHGHMGARISDTTGPPELRHVIAVFNSMAEEVERLIHRQQEFVSNASHELRNPLNALLLRIEHLGMGLPEESAAELEWVREEGRRMTRILDALLMLARGQGVESHRTPIDVGDLVVRRLEAWRVISQQQDVTLVLENHDVTRCVGDEIIIESALDVVLDNAVKFSPAGTSVDVSLVNGGETVTIAVRDHGPGLAADEVGMVTERFWRSPRHKNAPGSGLGLAIASEFLHSCGGRLEVERAQGGGLVVSLLVPANGATT